MTVAFGAGAGGRLDTKRAAGVSPRTGPFLEAGLRLSLDLGLFGVGPELIARLPVAGEADSHYLARLTVTAP